jgi:two-component system KDP operon response regulator KdpE
MIEAMVPSVLVVDDDPDFLALATRILEAMGVERIVTAPNAAAAVALAAAHRPYAALVDLGLPDRDGTDLGQELAALAWSPRVVLTSADPDAVTALDPSPGAGSLPFLSKEDLAEGELRRLLGSA